MSTRNKDNHLAYGSKYYLGLWLLFVPFCFPIICFAQGHNVVEQPGKFGAVGEHVFGGAAGRYKLWQAQFTSLDIRNCYKAYREIILRFQPKSVFKVASKDDALALAEKKGVDVLAHLGKIFSARQMRRLRPKISNRLLKKFKINWRSRLSDLTRHTQHYYSVIEEIVEGFVEAFFGRELGLAAAASAGFSKVTPRSDG